MLIEEHYTQVHGVDTRWILNGQKTVYTNELFIVQARPETVQSQSKKCSQQLSPPTKKSGAAYRS